MTASQMNTSQPKDATQTSEQDSFKLAIVNAWLAGYYHAGYTHDSAYAETEAQKYAGDTSPAACITGDAARALEFAEYMATAAARCIESLHKRDELAAALDDGGHLHGDEEASREHYHLCETAGEHLRRLRSAVYEFRKRAARAAAPAGVPQDSAPPLLDKAADPPQEPA